MNLNKTDNYMDYIGKFLFLISFFILGLMIFLIIQKPFLHVDEWVTQGILNISFVDMLQVTAADTHPPLYHIIVWLPVNILNSLHIPFDKIFVMKMMSVISYVILYIISFFKIRKDYGWFAGGLFTFVLLTMCDFFTVFSIARMYPLGILLLVCGFISAGEILKNSNRKNWLVLTLFAVLGAYTHYFVALSFVVLFGLLFLYYFVKNRSELGYWFSSVIYGVLCFIPWAFILFQQFSSVKGAGFRIKELTFNNILEFFSSVFTTSQESVFVLIGCAIFFVLFILVLREYKKSPIKQEVPVNETNIVLMEYGETPKEYEFILLGLLIFIGTIFCGVIVSILFRPIILVRYLTPAIAVVWLSFSIFISIFISKFDFKTVILPIMIVILLFGAVNLYGQIDEISNNHDVLVENQNFLNSINNNDSVVVITNMIKYVHFHDVLNDSIVYQGYTIGEREGARDFAKIYDDKNSTFLIPDDVEKYENKTIYIVTPNSKNLDLPSGYSLEPVWTIDNSEFLKLKHSK